MGWGHNNRVHSESELALAVRGGLASMDTVDWSLVTGAGRPESGSTRNLDGGNLIRDPIMGSDWSYSGPASYSEAPAALGAVYNRYRAVIGPDGGTGGYIVFSPFPSGDVLERFAVTPGETLFAAWWGYRAPGADDAFFLLNVYDAAGGYVATTGVPGSNIGTADTSVWKRCSGQIVIPAGWAFVLPHVGYNGSATGALYVACPYLGRSAQGADITGQNTALNTLNVGSQSAAALVLDAATAMANAASAQSSISIIVSDGYLGRAEKPAIIKEWQAVDAEYAVIGGRAGALGLGAHALAIAWSAAYAALAAYLSSLSPGWSNVSVDTPIVAATFRGRWTDYYYARQLLLDLFTSTVSATADSKTRNVDRGAWVSHPLGTEFFVGDEVQDQGAAENGPPSLPTKENSFWRLRAEAGAEGVTVAGNASFTVSTTASGSPLAGQLPQSEQLKLLRGAIDLTASADWTVEVQTGCTLSVEDGNVSLLTLGAATASGEVMAVLAGVEFRFPVSARRAPAGSSALALTQANSFPTSDGYVVTATTADLPVPAGRAVSISTFWQWWSEGGFSTVNAFAQYSSNGGGSWSGVGSVASGSAPSMELGTCILGATLPSDPAARLVRFRVQASCTGVGFITSADAGMIEASVL
ncbi:MAG: hypothetical protein DI568_08920 [Sphingomonas sp.]|nr:MAG: hypothetical protein DI568_08920 [Sphingomonas sp.]